MSEQQYLDFSEVIMVHTLDLRRYPAVVLAAAALRQLMRADEADECPEVGLHPFPELESIVLTVRANSTLALEMKCLNTVSHLADACAIDVTEDGGLCLSLVFQDMFVPVLP